LKNSGEIEKVLESYFVKLCILDLNVVSLDVLWIGILVKLSSMRRHAELVSASHAPSIVYHKILKNNVKMTVNVGDAETSSA